MLRHLWLPLPPPRVCLKRLRSSRSKLIRLKAELTRLMAMFPPLPRSQGWPSPRMLLIRGFAVFFSHGLMGLIWSVKILWRNTPPGVKIVKSYLSCLRSAITPRTMVPKVGWQCFQVPTDSQHVEIVFMIKHDIEAGGLPLSAPSGQVRAPLQEDHSGDWWDWTGHRLLFHDGGGHGKWRVPAVSCLQKIWRGSPHPKIENK